MQTHEPIKQPTATYHESSPGIITGAYNKARQIVGRVGLAASLLLGGGITAVEMVADQTPVAAAETGGYPWADAPKVPQPPAADAYTWGYDSKTTCDDKSSDYDCSSATIGGKYFRDPWGYDLRNCTSYVAWRVAKEFGVSVAGWGNADTWDNNASGKYTVDTTPEPGDIAVWDSMHVAFVEEVKDGKVRVSEYNQRYDGNFRSDRWTTANRYIDINGTGKGLDSATPANPAPAVPPSEAKPFALKRGAGTEVFYRDTNDRLESAGFGANGWTGPYPHSGSDMASNPVAVSRGTDSMDVFYRDYAGNIENVGWNAATGWAAPVPRVTDHSVSGDLGVISRSPDSMDVFYRNSSGNLVNIGWSALTGWHNAQTLVANGSVDGSPVAGRRGKNGMDVFYRDKNNNLEDIGWDAATGWQPPYTRASGVKGNPTAIARTDKNMDVFFRDSHNGLDNAWWDATSGWHTQGLENSGVNSDPTVLTRTSNDMSVFYIDTSGRLKEKSWGSSGGWNGTADHGSGANGSPAAVARTSGNMDIFARGSNGQLLNFWWDWQVGWSVGDPVKGGVRP